jgi:ABC-type phosphate transport system auxiliary subunit
LPTRRILKRPVSIAESKYSNSNRYRRQQLKGTINLKAKNLLQQIKIEKLLVNSKIDKKKIAELERKLEDLQKKYNQLDDESIPVSKV